MEVPMQLLLTNDDGIDAPGLQALFTAAAHLGDPIVIAPDAAHSGCGHRVTTDRPFQVAERAPRRFAVAGTPADCVRVGLHSLAASAAWVLAGINAGGNLGADIYHSGTVAAAREAVLHGRPAIALSHYRRRGADFDWELATRMALPVLHDLLQRPWSPGMLWNVNFPHLASPPAELPSWVHCPLDTRPLPLSFARDGEWFRYDGNYHQRERDPGSDVDTCFGGRIAVCCLRLA
jgi:5'-nucleotidase